MKKRYWVLKRVSVILILLALFTKMHAQKVQYTQYHHILTHSYEQLLPVYKNLNKILNTFPHRASQNSTYRYFYLGRLCHLFFHSISVVPLFQGVKTETCHPKGINQGKGIAIIIT